MSETRSGEEPRSAEPRRFGNVTVTVRVEDDLTTWENLRCTPVLPRFFPAPCGEQLVPPFDIRGFLEFHLGDPGDPAGQADAGEEKS